MRSVLVLLLACALALGCANTTTQQARKTEAAGFLANPGQLQEGGDDEALLVYRNPAADFKRYDKVLVIVERTGPGVLRVRVAITEADGSNVALDIVSSVIPQIRLLVAAAGLGTNTQLFVGSAGLEGELLDGMTGERLFAAVDRRGGGRTFEGVTATWDDVQNAFDFWADRLRTRLAEERAR